MEARAWEDGEHTAVRPLQGVLEPLPWDKDTSPQP